MFFCLGITVPTQDGSTHRIRVFPLSITSISTVVRRSNENYDKVMKLKNPSDDKRKGYLGECALRSLTYFDVGRSFLTDSLHNLYGGTMVSQIIPNWLVIGFTVMFVDH